MGTHERRRKRGKRGERADYQIDKPPSHYHYSYLILTFSE
jgi:hypothetical protein